MTSELQGLVLTRLDETNAAEEVWALSILAALEGSDSLDRYLEGTGQPEAPSRPEPTKPGPPVEPPGAYVESITVEGFRGVGAAVTLKFPAGPGLVLIVGRNGSGKSSFAEGLELLLTNRNSRWERKTSVWKDGWHNLHHVGAASLKATLLVEGQGVATATRTWTSASLDDNAATVVQPGKSSEPLTSLQWDSALETFRPFLSFNELGALLEAGPSKVYDALHKVLGLDELTEVQETLASALKTREEVVKTAKAAAKYLEAAVKEAEAGASDARLAAAAQALRWSKLDVARLEELVAGGGGGDDAELALLDRLRELAAPDLDVVSGAVSALREAEGACLAFAGTDAARSRARAEILGQALEYHSASDHRDCPVCGAGGALSDVWRSRAEEEVVALRQEARACEQAFASRKAAVRDAQRLVTAVPQVLNNAASLGLSSVPAAVTSWTAWAALRDVTGASELAQRLEDGVVGFIGVVQALVSEADVAFQKREDVWRPIALRVGEWLHQARAAVRAQERLGGLKAARDWMKDASDAIREERYAPISERAIAIWNQLRLNSSVDLQKVELAGTGKGRRVDLITYVDGSRAEALGVMSQGELYSLALSLFLPRATLTQSPFRFVWIDDPVQSMDPARVDGLARVLGDVAKTRQVVVFTHDDRLPEAVRRLGIPATRLEVTRQANSTVEVRSLNDPVNQALEDASAVALTKELPRDVVARVVPGFCRTAVEATCMEIVRRRQLRAGHTHEVVEALLADNATTLPLLALALFDDPKQAGGVLKRVNAFGGWAGNVVQDLRKGAHVPHEGDCEALVNDTRSFCRKLVEACK